MISKEEAAHRYRLGLEIGMERYQVDLERRQGDPVGYWKEVLLRNMHSISWICEHLGKLTGKEYAVVLLEKERDEDNAE